MTREDIQLALRLVAHGRVNHPQVEELAEKLAVLFAVAGVGANPLIPNPLTGSTLVTEPIPVADFVAAVDEAVAPKRARKAKAD